SAQLQFLSANAQVRGAVEQAIPQLREALAEQGISLGDTSVGEQRQDPDQQFAGSMKRHGTGGSVDGGEAIADASATGEAAAADITLEGRVDLYA
ncbi:MAG TPA: flagellar hook-length control protein FliK, partial [Halomonas sp.]|nr:flagellar hook-length control protein FliK [Halomonas sp.]